MALRSCLRIRGGRLVVAAGACGALLYAPSARADEIRTHDGLSGASSAAHITVQSDRENTTLMRLSGSTYETICVAPCIADADPHATYIIAGDGVTPSSRFRLPEGPSPSLHVKAGSLAMDHGGGTALVSGVIFGVVGAAFLLGSKLTEPSSEDSRVLTQTALADQQSSATRFRTIGYIGLGVGASAIVLGLVLIFTTQTDVFSGSQQIASAAPKKVVLTPSGLAF